MIQWLVALMSLDSSMILLLPGIAETPYVENFGCNSGRLKFRLVASVSFARRISRSHKYDSSIAPWLPEVDLVLFWLFDR